MGHALNKRSGLGDERCIEPEKQRNKAGVPRRQEVRKIVGKQEYRKVEKAILSFKTR